MRRSLTWAALLGLAAALSLLLPWPRQSAPPTAIATASSPADTNDTADVPVAAAPAGQTVVEPVADAKPAATNTDDSDPLADPEQIAASISTLGETEVRDWLAKLSDGDLAGNTAHLLMRRWVELDPAVAAGWAAQVNDADARRELVDAAAVAWSEKDLPTALSWVEALANDGAKQQALTDLGYETARVDPVSALMIVSQLPAGGGSDGLLLHAMAQYASADPAQSQSLALSLAPGPLRDQAVTTVATVQAKQDGAQAAEFAVENVSPGPDLDRAVIGVVQGWAQSDFYGAAAWVQGFPDSPIRDQADQALSQYVTR